MPTCMVCGRPFPDGQGIVISRGSIYMAFHSSRCASKFLQRMIKDAEDISCLEKLYERTSKEFEEAMKKKLTVKRI